MIYTLHSSDQFQLRTDKITDERCSVSDIFGKQVFAAIKVLRKDKKKLPDGKIIFNYITQHNATNLDENSVLNAIKLLIKGNFPKNAPTKGGDSYYIVSEDSSTTVISDNNDMERPLKMRKYQN